MKRYKAEFEPIKDPVTGESGGYWDLVNVDDKTDSYIANQDDFTDGEIVNENDIVIKECNIVDDNGTWSGYVAFKKDSINIDDY